MSIITIHFEEVFRAENEEEIGHIPPAKMKGIQSCQSNQNLKKKQKCWMRQPMSRID